MVVTIGMTPVHTGFWRSMPENAALKSLTTPAATGATIGPVIVHPVLVIPPAKVVPTSPLMPMPGPVSVQVTVPLVGMAFAPRTVKGPGKLHDAGVILPDGRILCWAQEPGHGSRLYLQEGASWKAISPEFGDPRVQFQTVLSPAGDRVAARHGRDLMLVSSTTGEARAVSGWDDSHIAGWTADGRSLYQGRANGDHFEILKWNLETQKAEPWKRIEVKGAMPVWIRVTPDGQHYAYTYQMAATDAFVVTGLR